MFDNTKPEQKTKKTVQELFDDAFKLIRLQEKKVSDFERQLKEQKEQNEALLRRMAYSGSGDAPKTVGFTQRLGMRLNPQKIPIDYHHIEKLIPSSGQAFFGETEAVFQKEIKLPEINTYYLWAIDFALVKPDAQESNSGLLNSFLCKSAQEIPMYPFPPVPVTELDWRYVGRDFFWGLSIKSGNRKLNNESLRPSSDCIKPYGYVLPEDLVIPKSHTIRIEAKPIATNNAWNAGTPQYYDLYVILRMYELMEYDSYITG